MEQSGDLPVPEVADETLEVIKDTAQKRISERMDVPVPRTLEEIVKVIDVPVP